MSFRGGHKAAIVPEESLKEQVMDAKSFHCNCINVRLCPWILLGPAVCSSAAGPQMVPGLSLLLSALPSCLHCELCLASEGRRAHCIRGDSTWLLWRQTNAEEFLGVRKSASFKDSHQFWRFTIWISRQLSFWSRVTLQFHVRASWSVISRNIVMHALRSIFR